LRAVIIANGELSPPISIETSDVLIAADGGARHCLALGLQPAFVIGDLDSLTEEEISRLQSGGAQVIQFPTRKNSTDLELALQHAELLRPDEILIYGALGKRWDQTTANLLLACAYPLARLRLVDGDQEILYVRARETLLIEGEAGDTVSLIPLSGDAAGITTKGLDYPLKDERLSFGSTRGVSNVLLANRAEVTLREGLLACVVIHQTGSPIQEEEHED